MKVCTSIDEAKKNGENLRVLIYIEEAIIFLSILTSIGMIFRSRNVYKRLITNKKEGSIPQLGA